MTSQYDDTSCDDTSSSLGDSSYDFVDDRSIPTTDDEDQDAMAESATSNDGHDLDHPGIRQLPGNLGHLGVESIHSHVSSVSSGQDTHSSSNHSSRRELNQQASTDQVPPKQQQEPQETIEFVEPSVTNLNFSRPIEVSHTLRMIEGLDPAVNNFYPNMPERRSGKVAVNVRQTMASHGLQLRGRPYKILYIGDSSMRDVIIQKIATALAASLNSSSSTNTEKPRPSRFNVVPISAFGEETSPEVILIDSSGLEMTVEDCSFASFTRNDGGNDTIRMLLSDGSEVISFWSGSKFVITKHWRTPDIAVICMSNRDSVAVKQTRRIVRSLMSRHSVQTLVITESSPWDSYADPVTLDNITPHIHLEPREPMALDRTQMVRRLPIDLTTFLSIDAGQMNRNLACLDAAQGSSKGCAHPNITSFRKSSHGRLSFQQIYDAFVTDIGRDGLKGLNRYEYMAGFVVMLMSILCIGVVGFGLAGSLGASRASNSRVFPANLASTSALSVSTSTTADPAPPFLPSSSALTPDLASSTPARVSPARSLSTDTDIAAFLLDAYTLAPNKSEQFKVHVLGDCHIVLRPPHWFSKMKKAPRLLFKITRGGKIIEHTISTLFDGVYALQIPREDSYGVLGVAVWTESKPKIKESFEVDFGSSWFKVAGWKKASQVLTESLRGDLISIQTSLSIFYDYTKIGLSESLQQQKAKIAARRQAERAMLRSHLEAAARTKELVVAQAKGLIKSISGTLNEGHTVAAYGVKQQTEKVSRHLAVYVRSKISMISQARRSNAKMFRGLGIFSQRHLRETQKRTLQILWKFGGLPKKIKVAKGQERGLSRD